MSKTAETLERIDATLESATNVIDFWRQRAEAWNQECNDLRKRLAAVTDLVPEAKLLEALANALDSAIQGRWVPETMTEWRRLQECARDLAAAIRTWREGQEREGDKMPGQEVEP